MSIDLATLIPQIDQLAKAIDDTTVDELEASLEHAFTGEGWDPPARVAEQGLDNEADREYREGFLAGMVWAIVLARKGAPTVRALMTSEAK